MAVTTADPSKAYLWLTGDAYRAPADTKLPEGDLLAEAIKGWDAYGGIEAGFEQTSEQSVTEKQVFNYRKAPYKIARDPLKEGIKFRAVDNTKATLLTRAQGGKIIKKGEHYAIEKGVGEEFAIFIRVEDGTDAAFFYSPRVTLKAPATRAAIDGQNIDGWEFDVSFLSPMVEIIPALPEGVTVDEDESASTEDSH
ncbi:hypothetical protein SAMN04488531_1730 [Corynebacterium coyleae]|uniref:Phage tail protein n=1 Tax=Corynebacterium coyleae TaxID=53374 RepID=A0ABX8KTU2_9CORY|nr:hypothetical protein [Corynebacterium coyleae]QXB17892.1 hypothetical protein I6L55_08300 [Corynebacterium coyleae]WJY79333.1 hypothetical protein CCOY_03570 [Corynebacterium coyleae]SEB75228.1 hypothetical protein SAMN04488531_1730 [Corynebacterium coyleae]